MKNTYGDADIKDSTEIAAILRVAQLIEDKKNLNITIENAAEWSQKQADEIEKLSEALERCKAWFFQHAPTAVLPDGTGQEAHREITDVLFRAEIPA